MTSRSAVRTSRRSGRVRLLSRGLCVVTLGGLTLSAVSTTAAAAPVVVQAPLARAVVGVREGAKGDDVKAVQTALVAAGVTVPGGADGVFGPATKSAVTAFQSRKGLAVTGEVDAPTAAALGLAQAPAAAAGPAGGLVVGAQGPNVAELQRALMAAGVYVPGGADGVFGQATKVAVSNYQRWNSLTVTGDVDAATSSRLKLGTGAVPAAAPAPAPAPAPAAAPAAVTSIVGLTAGARGEGVKSLQRALIAAGITVRGGADGVFGTMTTSAVSAYQTAKGLAATGTVDEATAAGLNASPAPAAPAAPAPAPAAPSANPFVGMTVGATGDPVKQLQRALISTGLVLRGGADGVFGNATRTVLISFQKVNSTPQTGAVSEKDASVLGLGSGAGVAPQGIVSPAGFAVFGERGARVKSVQDSLIAGGISVPGGADGIFGAATAGAIMEFQRRSGLAPTGKLDDQTASRLGSAPAPAPAPPSAVGVTIDVFPVQGRCWFGDTWQAPRGAGRLHEGVDVIAAKGNLLYAAVSGTISKMYWDTPGARSGNGLRIQQDNGTYFTYLHMDAFAADIAVGNKVVAGQVVGTVGTTGNSATPHLHLEVHPSGGAAVNPYPLIKPIDACAVTTPRP